MKKIFLKTLILLCLSWQSIALAAPHKTYLLLSFADEVKRGRSIQDRTVKQFLKYSKKLEDKIILYKEVTATTLSRILKDKETKAVFWVSHGGFESFLGSQRSVIKDFKGNEVQDLFYLGHKDLKYIGIISCNSGHSINEKRTNSTIYWSSKKKVTPTGGVKSALKAYKKTIDKNIIKKPKEQIQMKSLSIKRVHNAQNFNGYLRVILGNETIGFMTPSDKTDFYNFSYPSYLDESKIKLSVENEDRESYLKFKKMGKISIDNNKAQWLPFTTRSGLVLEGSTRLFLKK